MRRARAAGWLCCVILLSSPVPAPCLASRKAALGGLERDQALGFLVQRMLAAEAALAEARKAGRADGPAAESFAAKNLELAGGAAELRQSMDVGNRARSELVMQAMAGVYASSRRYAALGILARQDLEQEGALGLIRAAERYDPSRGVRFSTYAQRFADGAMLDALAKQGVSVSSLPAQFFSDLSGFRRANQELQAHLGRAPTIRELAEATGVTEARAALLMQQAAQVLSLAGDAGGRALPVASFGRGTKVVAPAGGGAAEDALLGSSGLTSLAGADVATPEREVAMEETARELQDAMRAEVGEAATEVLSLRFGLGGEGELSAEEVAARLGMTAAQVKEVEAGAFETLKGSLSAVKRLAPLANLAEGEAMDIQKRLANAIGGKKPAAKAGKKAAAAPRARRRRRGVFRQSIEELEEMKRRRGKAAPGDAEAP